MYISVDLDETLFCTILAEYCSQEREPDAIIPVFKNGEMSTAHVYLRPGVYELLEGLSRVGELNVYTHSVRSYATRILQDLGLNKFFDRVFTREDTLENLRYLSASDLGQWGYSRDNAVWLKDLRLVNPDVELVVGIDNEIKYYPPPFRKRVVRVPNYDRASSWFRKASVEPCIKELIRSVRSLM